MHTLSSIVISSYQKTRKRENKRHSIIRRKFTGNTLVGSNFLAIALILSAFLLNPEKATLKFWAKTRIIMKLVEFQDEFLGKKQHTQ